MLKLLMLSIDLELVSQMEIAVVLVQQELVAHLHLVAPQVEHLAGQSRLAIIVLVEQ
jgi:hypothetical protein